MTIRERLTKHKKWKQNPIEHALHAADKAARAAPQIINLRGLCDFLKSHYGITNVTPVASIICNKFLTGTDANGRELFIKTGHHTGIYENEYNMGRRLYDIDPEHFLEPLYYNDFDTFNFFANEYARGQTLKTAIMTNALSREQKSRIINDIWMIFSAMRKSDVVHRDVRPDNLMIINGRLVLIDFQLAVSKTNFVELEYLAQRPNRLRKLGGTKYRYKPFVWDDAYSLLKVMEFVGRDKYYGMRYDIIYKHIKEHVGQDKLKTSVRENDFHRMVRHIRALHL